jgi:hypothetical protein
MVFAFPNLVALSEREWGLMFIGQHERHDTHSASVNPEVAPPATRPAEWRWAMWAPHCLTAIEAPVEGRLTLVERLCAGSRLVLNYCCALEGGEIRCELVREPRPLHQNISRVLPERAWLVNASTINVNFT